MPRSSDSSNVPDQPIGQAWLRANLDLAVPRLAHESFVGTGARRTEIQGDRVREPTGAMARRAWFQFETFTGERLDLPDATRGNDAPALDPRRHLVAARVDSRRHRVADNLLGDARSC